MQSASIMETVEAAPAPAPAASSDAAPSPALSAEQRARRAARNRKWREVHKEAIRIKRADKRGALKLNPEKLAAKLVKDREIRKQRMQDPAVRARVAALRRAWRARVKAAKAGAAAEEAEGAAAPASNSLALAEAGVAP